MIFTRNNAVSTSTGYFQGDNATTITGSISIEAYFMTPDNLEGTQAVYSCGVGEGAIAIFVNYGILTCFLPDGFYTYECSPSTKYHVVMVNNEETMTKQLYVNGVSIDSSVASAINLSERMVIGAVVGGSAMFQGKIYHIRVFKGALSLSNHSPVKPSVSSLWNGGAPQEYSITPECKDTTTGTLLGEWLAVNASSSIWKNSSYRPDLDLLPKSTPTFDTIEYTGIQVPWGDITDDLISIYSSGTSGKKRIYVESPMNYTRLDRSKTITISPVDGDGNSATVTITQPMIGIGDMAIDVTFAIAQV